MVHTTSNVYTQCSSVILVMICMLSVRLMVVLHHKTLLLMVGITFLNNHCGSNNCTLTFDTLCIIKMSQSETNQIFIVNYCSGILLTDGPFWVELRRFTIRHLKDFGFGKKSAGAVILEETEQLMKEMKEEKVVQVSNWL